MASKRYFGIGVFLIFDENKLKPFETTDNYSINSCPMEGCFNHGNTIKSYFCDKCGSKIKSLEQECINVLDVEEYLDKENMRLEYLNNFMGSLTDKCHLLLHDERVFKQLDSENDIYSDYFLNIEYDIKDIISKVKKFHGDILKKLEEKFDTDIEIKIKFYHYWN